MEHRIIIAGFGGQGVLFIGRLLTYAGMLEGKNVAWVPSYGPEMRGGTAHCFVTISDDEISSPVVEESTAILIFNQPSLVKFEGTLVNGGVLVLNSSLIKERSSRDDIQQLIVPANDLALASGTESSANMVMLGTYLKNSQPVKNQSVETALHKMLPGRLNLVAKNLVGLKLGLNF